MSIPFTLAASARSSAKSRCVSATTRSAPIPRRREAAASAVVAGSAKRTPGPGEDRCSVSGVSRPMKPSFTLPTSMTARSPRPGITLPSGPRMLVPSHRKRDALNRSSATAGPKSYSWFPGTASWTPTSPISSTICSPLVSPERIEGEIRSPPKVVTLFGFRARSCRSRVMNGAKPPCPFTGAIS